MENRRTSIVLGAGFGDEGKGMTTSFLAFDAKTKPLVVRFNGGHQAGHTVQYKGKQHTFTNFGAATLQDAHTYWSRFCTFSPSSVCKEYLALKDAGIYPVLFVDNLAPVCTPMDMHANMAIAHGLGHGSCGLGFGTTIQRQEDNFKLFFQDLFSISVLRTKLDMIANYYRSKGLLHEDYSKHIQGFIEDVKYLIKHDVIRLEQMTGGKIAQYDHVIFEGAQGILLDMDYGFFPHVTRSHTTSRNAMQIIREFDMPLPAIYYVTRSYQTRHGIGPMSNEAFPVELKNNEKENNVLNEFQGQFRTGALDLDLLSYAIRCDINHSRNLERHLMVTCLDQTGYSFQATHEGSRPFTIRAEQLKDFMPCKFKSIIHSTGPHTETHTSSYQQQRA